MQDTDPTPDCQASAPAVDYGAALGCQRNGCPLLRYDGATEEQHSENAEQV